MQIAIVVEATEVAGSVPSVLECCCLRNRTVAVTARRSGRTYFNTSKLPWRRERAIFEAKLDVDTRPNPASVREGLGAT